MKSLNKIQLIGRLGANPVITRIKKLLKLGESPNEHEASLALSRARELMVKHGIDESGQEENMSLKLIGDGPRGLAKIWGKDQIIAAILEHFGVHVVWFPSRTLESKFVRIPVGHGIDSDLQVADYIHSFLKLEIEVFWNRYKKQTGRKGRSAKDSYQKGLLLCLWRKLIAREPESPSGTGLMVLKGRAIEKFVREVHPRAEPTGGFNAGTDRARFDGLRDGENLTIRHGIKGSGAKQISG